MERIGKHTSLNGSRTQATDSHVHDPSRPSGSSCSCPPDGDSSSPSSCTFLPPLSPSWEKDCPPFVSCENHCLPGRTTTPLFNCKSPLRQTLSPMPHTALSIISCKNSQVKKYVFHVHYILLVKLYTNEGIPQNYWFSKRSRKSKIYSK